MLGFTKIKNVVLTNYNENLPYLIVGLVCGLICCLYAKFFSYLEHLALKAYSTYPSLIFIAAPLLIGVAFLLIQKLAPGAAGSGIPQVMTCIEPEHRHRTSEFLNLKIIVVKILSSGAAVLGGAAIGREGPSLQISASIGALAAKYLKKMNVTVKTEQLLIAGAASGLAAAFNTPIGGIIYAIEELSLEHVRSYKTVLILSVVIAGLTAQLLLGNYLYLGYPEVFSKIEFKAIVIVSLVGFLSGILGALFSTLLTHLSGWRKKRSSQIQLVIALMVGLVLSLAFYYMGDRYIFSGKESINYVLFSPNAIGYGETLSRFIMPILSSMTGIAGGIFAPALSAGAALGGLVSSLMNDPALKTLLGLSGMIGFLNGVTRTPITSFVLVQEMTDRHSAVMPMMLAAVFSSLGASLFGHKSFYERTAEELKSVVTVKDEGSTALEQKS